MPNIACIAVDDKVRRQVEKLIAEFKSDEVKLDTFRNAKEFENSFFPPPKQPGSAKKNFKEDKPAESEPEEPAGPRPLHLIIFAMDSLGEKLQPWCSRIMKLSKQRGSWPESNRTRLVMLKFEDDGIHKLDVLIPELDDLIYLPLDRLVFLQKIELIMNLPKKIKGSFLFSQQVTADIEISKITKLEKINDVGIAVRNPLPFLKGMRTKVYVNLPGEKETVRFFAKAIYSDHHPDYPDQYICYFSFFGLRRKELSSLRLWLGKLKKYKALINSETKDFKLDRNDPIAVDDAGPEKTLVVIDPYESKSLEDQISKEIDHIKIVSEPSYTQFLFKHLKKTGLDGSRQAVASDFPQNTSILFKASISNSNATIDANFADSDTFLGFPAKSILKSGSPDWWKPFRSESNDAMWAECVELAKQNRAVVKTLAGKTQSGESVVLKISLKGVAEDEMQVELAPVTTEEFNQATQKGPKLERVDAILIDVAFIPQTFDGWLEYLKNALTEAKCIARPEDLRLIITCDREDRLEKAWLDSTSVVGYCIKPFDLRTLLFNVSQTLKADFTKYRSDNIGWAEAMTNLHISKEIVLESISEFGASLRSPTPVRPGTVFFLRKLIFDQAPNACLAAKVLFCEEHPSEKGQFLLSVTYFGITDQFLKYARTWIRESYALSKSKEGA